MTGLVEPAGTGDGFRSAMQARLMKSYMALPDMEHVKLAMDNWLGHQLVDTRSFVTEEELRDLWSRAYEVRASTTELAFLFSFLVAAGAASLTDTAGMDKATIDALYSVNAATRFVIEALELLYMDSLQHPAPSSNTELLPVQAGGEGEYDWRSLARCPPLLLASRTHSILCCFFHQAREAVRSMQHGNYAIQAARAYGLFDKLRGSSGQGHEVLPPSRMRHLYGLRRLHFDLTVYPRLAMSVDVEEQCVMLPDEACCDHRLCDTTLDGRPLEALALDYQCLKLVLSEVRATTYRQGLAERALRSLDDHHEWSPNQGRFSEAASYTTRDSASRILANDDAVLAIMKGLPSWSQVDARTSWTSAPMSTVFNGTSAINTLWARCSCNRMRTDNLLQVPDQLDLTTELQARALEAAQDTLFLLAQVYLLLRTQYKFAFSHNWLYKEAEWAVGVFNQVMLAEIAQEVAKSSTPVPSSRPSAITPPESKPTTPFSQATTSMLSRASISSTSGADGAAAQGEGAPKQTDSSMLQQQHLLAGSPTVSSARERSYGLFAWYIFGFERISTTLKDLHCFSPALFESSKMLLRLRVPRPIALHTEQDLPPSPVSVATQHGGMPASAPYHIQRTNPARRPR